MQNNQLKAWLLGTELPLYQRKISKLQFEIDAILFKYDSKLKHKLILSKEDIKQIEDKHKNINLLQEIVKSKYGFDFNEREDWWLECAKINKAYYQRVKRLKTKVADMLLKKCVFVTLTFSDKYINTSTATKRKYAQRFFTQLNCDYVANIDYGKKNQRVHFHGLVQIDRVSSDMWHYGNIDFKAIYNKNDVAISKYICKLTNHAIKETTHGNRLLYNKK